MQHYIPLIAVLVCSICFGNARKLNIKMNEKVRVFGLKEVEEEEEEKKKKPSDCSEWFLL